MYGVSGTGLFVLPFLVSQIRRRFCCPVSGHINLPSPLKPVRVDKEGRM